MLVGRSFTEAAVLADGRVLVPGGNHVHHLGATVPEAEIFDPVGGSWSPTTTMVSPHAKHTVTVLDDGRVLVTGGEGRLLGEVRGNPLTVSEVFDPRTGGWTATGPMRTEVPFNHSATRLWDGRVLVAGGAFEGTGGSGTLDEAQLFDPSSDTWVSTSSMSVPRTYHASVRLTDGRVLVAGGHDGSRVPQATAEIWDRRTGTWSATGPMAFAHHSETNVATLVPDGRVLLVAGATVRNDGARDVTNAAQLYDPRTNRWRLAPAIPGPGRTDHVVTSLDDGRVLVAGGMSQDPLVPIPTGLGLRDAYLFDARTCSWEPVPAMRVERSNAAVAMSEDGSVLVIGGQHGDRDGARLNDSRVERFTPAATPWRSPPSRRCPGATGVVGS